MSKYYSVADDIKKFPDAFIIITYGGRATGKTYGGLRKVTEDNTRFVFIKRTMDDVKLLTAGNSLTGDNSKESKQFKMDVSPFKPLNRDFGWNIRAFSLYPGLGGFFGCDHDNNPVGDPKGYIMALSGAAKYKGFDMSEADVMIFDEFCPVSGMRPLKDEGKILLDLYETVSRDREQRGRGPLRLWCFANADNVVCPVTETFGIVDILAEMARKDQEYYYDKERRILIHKLKTSAEFNQIQSNKAIYKAMAGTPWADMALNNNFAFNDFSQVDKRRLKNMTIEARVRYENKYHYVYYDAETATRYITYSQCNTIPATDLDLSKDSHKQRFVEYAHYKVLSALFNSDDAKFETYSLYNLYRNCRKKFT